MTTEDLRNLERSVSVNDSYNFFFVFGFQSIIFYHLYSTFFPFAWNIFFHVVWACTKNALLGYPIADIASVQQM